MGPVPEVSGKVEAAVLLAGSIVQDGLIFFTIFQHLRRHKSREFVEGECGEERQRMTGTGIYLELREEQAELLVRMVL